MKVLVVVDSIWLPVVEITGVKSIYDIQKRLSYRDIEIHILTSIEKWTDCNYREWFKKEHKKNGIFFHTVDLGLIKNLPRLNFLITRFLFFFKVIHLNFKYNYDVIHEYSSAPLLINRTALYKVFFNVRTIHTLCTYNSFKTPNWIFLNKIDEIVVTNKDMEKQIHVRYRDKVKFIPIGVNIREVIKEQDNKEYDYLKSEANVKNILYVGPLEKRKGIQLLIKVIPKILNVHSEIKFIIATHAKRGTFYDYEKRKQELLDKIGNFKDRVILLEGKQHIPSLLRKVDIVILPYESLAGTLGIPLILIESMALGKVVVVSNLPSLKNIIADKYNGLIFAKGNFLDLYSKINSLFSYDNIFIDNIRKNATKTSKDYDNCKIAKKIRKNYRALLKDYN